MTIEKLPSGSYRIKQMENGHRYSVTVPYKPTKKEAYELVREKIDNRKDVAISFEEAANDYIDSKINILSPSTIREYHSTLRNLPNNLLKMDISDIDRRFVQKIINDHAKNHAPKTTRNVYGFISVVLKFYLPDVNLNITLPQNTPHADIVPSYDDIKRILDAVSDTDYYIPFYLAVLSLRCSEICALSMSDLNGNQLTISKALIRSDNGYVLKDKPKTEKSYRTISLPDELVDAITKKGSIYDGYPGNLSKNLRKTLHKLGLLEYGIHKLRHFFASYSHELGYSDAMIQKMGGWSTDNVMKRVYRHAMNEDQVAESIKKDFSF